MPFTSNTIVCFDLDDTLYKEIDFVRSAYGAIADWVGRKDVVPLMMEWFRAGENVFEKLNLHLNAQTPIGEYLGIYRNHLPEISLSEGVAKTLTELKNRGIRLGLITDGRSISQRNKIHALQLNRWFEEQDIVISEEFGSDKTDIRNFRFFEEKYPGLSYVYVGDNSQKDFFNPNCLHWMTYMLKDDGRNIHRQESVPTAFMPKCVISEFEDLTELIRK